MPILESSRKWEFTSTGTGKFFPAGTAREFNFGIQTSSGCTASVQILHRMGSTAPPSNGTDFILSTVQCTVADAVTSHQVGPFDYLSLRVKDKTAGGTTNVVTAYVRGV